MTLYTIGATYDGVATTQSDDQKKTMIYDERSLAPS